MAWAFLDCVWLTGTDSADSSDSITIPSGATYAVAFAVGYTGSGITMSALTVDSQTPDTVIHNIADGVEGDSSLYVAEFSGFTTGASKTVAWTWSATPVDGGVIGIAFFSDAELGNYGRELFASASNTASIDLTVSAGEGAFIFGASYDQDVNAAPTSSDQTEDSNVGPINGEYGAFGYENTLDTPTTNMACTGDFLVAFAFAIATPAGGGGATVPLFTNHYAKQRNR